eukprot:7023722-Alexandrium_andersonii.AAC.1
MHNRFRRSELGLRGPRNGPKIGAQSSRGAHPAPFLEQVRGGSTSILQSAIRAIPGNSRAREPSACVQS